MSNSPSPLDRLRPTLRVVQISVALLWSIFLLIGLLRPPQSESWLAFVEFQAAVGVYLVLLFGFFIPRFAGRAWFYYLQFALALPLLLGMVRALSLPSPVLDVLLALTVVIAVMLVDRGLGFLVALAGSAADFVMYDYGMLAPAAALELMVVRLLAYAAIALLVATAMQRAGEEWRAESRRAEQQSRATAQQLHETQTLYELATALNSSLDLREALTLGLRTALGALRMDAGFIALASEDAQNLRLEVQEGLPRAVVEQLAASPMPMAEGLIGLAVDQRRPASSADLAGDPRAAPPPIAETGYRSALVIPLTVGAQVGGVLSAFSTDARRHGSPELAFAQAIGEQVGLALLRARYVAQEQRQRELAETLGRVSSVLGGSLDLDSVLGSLLNELQRAFDYRSAAIMLLQGKSFHVRAARGQPSGIDLQTVRFDLDSHTHLAQMMMESKPVVIADTRDDPSWEVLPGYEYIRSWVGVPLWNGGAMIGSLNLDYAEPNAIRPEQVRLLSVFANQAAAAIERAQLFEKARRRLAQLSALNRVAQAISSALELSQVLRAVHAQVERLMEHKDFYIALYDEQLDEVDFVYYFDQGRMQTRPKRRGGNGLTEYVIRTSQPLLVKDDMAGLAAALGIRPQGSLPFSWLGVPLLKGENVVGVMAVQNYERANAFDEEDLELFQTLGDQVALAIENARLYEATRRNLQEAQALFEFSQKAAQTVDRYLIALGALSACDEVLRPATLTVYLYEGDPLRLDPLVRIEDHRVSSPDPRTTRGGDPDGIVGWVLRHREGVRIGDVRNERRYRGSLDTRSEMCLPIVLHETIIGVVDIESMQLDAFGPRDEQFATTLCAQLAAAFQSARVRELEWQRTFELQGLHEVSQVFGKLGDMRATYAEVTERIALIFHARSAIILRAEGQANQLRAQLPAFGVSDELSRNFVYALDEAALAVWNPAVTPFYIVNEPERLPAELQQRIRRFRGRHFMCASMYGREGLLGIVVVANRVGGAPFTARDGELLAVFARQAALAIENARLVETERISREQLEVINQAGQRAAASLELDGLLPELIEFLRGRLNYHSLALFVLQGDTLVLRSAAGRMPARIGYRQSIGEGVLGWVARNGAPRLVNNVAAEPVFVDPAGMGMRSEISVPLVSRGEVIGVLDAASDETDQFTPSDLVLLGTLADQVAQAIVNARLYERERQGRQQVLLVNRVARRILSINNLNALTQEIASAVVESLQHKLVATFLVAGNELVLKGRAGPLADLLPAAYRHPVTEGILGLVARTGQTYLSRDTTADPNSVDRVNLGIRSQLTVPLRDGDKVIGLLVAAADAADAFVRDDVTTLETVADQAAQAIANVRAYETEQRRAQYMHLVATIGSEITSLLNLNDLLPRTATLIQQYFHYHTVHIFLADERQAVARLAAAAGDEFLPVEAGLELRIGEQGLIGQALGDRRPVLASDVRRNPAYFEHPRLTGIECELVVPIHVGDRILGALDAQDRRRDAFGDDDLQIMQTLANQLAAAITNAELHAAVEHQARTDSVTEVNNHGYFLHRLHEEFERSGASRTCLALIMLDIDHFKLYNDRYGHVLGDRVLQATAQAIRQNIKHTDIVGRWGGEEFGVALPETTMEQALMVAERIRATLANFPLFDERGQPIEKPTVSQGIAVFPDHALTLELLVDLADRMLYEAKEQGRDQIVPYRGDRPLALVVASDAGR